MMSSHLMMGKILLCFLIPSLLSLHVVAGGGEDGVVLSWLRYWVVLGTGLVLEYILEKLEGVTVTVVKIVLVLWCLAPVEYNGSDVLFTYVLLPIHNTIQYGITDIAIPALVYTKEVVMEGMEIMGEKVFYPSMDILASGTSVALSAASSFIVHSYNFIGDITGIWFQKMLPPINCAIAIFQHIGINVLEGIVLGLEKLVELVGKTPELAATCFYSSVDLAIFLFNEGYIASLASANKISELSLFVFDCLVSTTIYASEKSLELSLSGGQAVMATMEDGVSYYKKNQENPRLFSQVVKTMIYR